MKKQDYGWIAALALFAAFIWCRDLRWLAAADDILPIVAGLPLFVWLKWPLRFRAEGGPVATGVVFLAAALFAGGVLFGSTLVLTLSWLTLLWAWIAARWSDGREPATRRLLVLPFFSFPWIATDFEQLGWWFRLSGAAAAEQVLAFGHANVARDGTFLSVNGFQLSVEPACSGLNGLQSLLIAGTMLAFITLKQRPLFWPSLLALPVAAWVANVLRILSGALVALTMDAATAARWVGPLHSIAGWLALGAMFGLCWALFSQLARVDGAFPGRLRVRARNAPWLESALLVYAGWSCRNLLTSWFTNPFDRLGWIAFALWLLPLGVVRHGGLLPAGSGARRPWFLGLGLALVALGDVGELNACQHAGLALILIGFAPRRGRAVWALSAAAWMPPLGWVASRFGLDPGAMAVARVTIATVGLAWALHAHHTSDKTQELDYVGRIKTIP